MDSGWDNAAVARLLGQIADLLEIKGENPFKIRAYRNAADIVGHAAERVADMDEAGLRAWGGIGKDLATRIVELAATGDTAVRRDLLREYPLTLLDVLALQGVGPKTAGRLYHELGIASLDDLAAAARAGRIRGLKGMGAKKEALILKALEERQQHSAGTSLSEARRPWTPSSPVARGRLRSDITAAGSLRRGADTCGDVDLVAVGAGPPSSTGSPATPGWNAFSAMATRKPRCSWPAACRPTCVVAADQRGAALQHFTGSKAHNIVLRDRALRAAGA